MSAPIHFGSIHTRQYLKGKAGRLNGKGPECQISEGGSPDSRPLLGVQTSLLVFSLETGKKIMSALTRFQKSGENARTAYCRQAQHTCWLGAHTALRPYSSSALWVSVQYAEQTLRPLKTGRACVSFTLSLSRHVVPTLQYKKQQCMNCFCRRSPFKSTFKGSSGSVSHAQQSPGKFRKN